MAQISNVSIIRLPVYIFELSNGYMYQQDKRKPGGSATSGWLSVAQLQRLRQGGIRISTTVRHRLTPTSERGSLLLAAAAKGHTIAVQ